MSPASEAKPVNWMSFLGDVYARAYQDESCKAHTNVSITSIGWLRRMDVGIEALDFICTSVAKVCAAAPAVSSVVMALFGPNTDVEATFCRAMW